MARKSLASLVGNDAPTPAAHAGKEQIIQPAPATPPAQTEPESAPPAPAAAAETPAAPEEPVAPARKRGARRTAAVSDGDGDRETASKGVLCT